MTVAPDVPALRFDTPAEAIAALREQGLRLSTARRLVLDALFAADGPVAATYLAETLVIDESSVYRNLEVLESHGLIRHVHLGHGPGLYVLLGGDEVEYLYCDRCAKVTPVAPDQLRPVHESIREHFGYETRFTHFAIVGLCADCAAQPRPTLGTAGEVGSAAAGSHGHRNPAELGASGTAPSHDHAHSHGDYVHSHPHPRTRVTDR
jgi:Fur family ferric uptake transcriptional regulator